MKVIPVNLAIGLVLMASPAAAAPVYLTCVFDRLANPIEVTVDEAESTATVFLPHSGYVKRSRAAFTADRVLFEDDVEPYELSRTDLTIIRGRAGSRRLMEGRCEVRQMPKRAF